MATVNEPTKVLDNDISADNFDITIVGGGLSGLLMAVSLTAQQTRPLNIALVETKKIIASDTSPFDDRVIALSHGSVSYLKQLNLWSPLVTDATAIKQIHISDRGHYGKARINAAEHNVEALGYVVPLAAMANVMLNRLIKNNVITWLVPESITNIEFNQANVGIYFESGKQISSQLVIGCDGGQSVCRKAANIGANSRDYQQAAVIANVELAKPHHHQAFERFTEQGPIAMLPMAGNQCSLVWTVSSDNAQVISQLNDVDFCQALEQAFGTWLGSITKTSQRSVFPLNLVTAEQQSYHRLALVGNASHTIHPIAGQGFNLGLRDVKVLAQLIEQARRERSDIAQAESDIGQAQCDLGSGALLNQYQTNRTQDQQSIIQLTDSMVSLFSNDLPPLVAGRNIGLKVMNYCTALQAKFVNKTMGY
ncbi:2-octaprenyl-6-methoxyphenyl hydroxylase [Colwellia sp. MEBiC06753]